MSRYRGAVSFLITLATVFGVVATSVAAKNGQYLGYDIVNVIVNGKPVQSDVPGILLNGRTVLPVRAVAEAVGATVAWDQDSQTVTLLTQQGSQMITPTYLWIDGAAPGWQSRVVSAANQPQLAGIIFDLGSEIKVISQPDLQLFINGKVSIDELNHRARFYYASAPGNDPANPSDMCSGTFAIMATQYDRIMDQDKNLVGEWVWPPIMSFWHPFLTQQNCSIPKSRADLPAVPAPHDTTECAMLRAVVEDAREKDVSRVLAILAANGTLGGSAEVELLWEANLKWDQKLMEKNCAP